MARMITDEFGLFLIIVTTLYGGELVWKERTIRHDQIHDALPMPDWLNFASQFTALAAVQFALLIVLLVSGVALQALRGYYHFELDVYAKELFLIAWPSYLEYAVVVLLLQTLLPNKFLGHAIVIGYFILGVVMFRFGFEDELYSFADTPNAVYSDMNGYGHFVQMLATFTDVLADAQRDLRRAGDCLRAPRHGRRLARATSPGRPPVARTDPARHSRWCRRLRGPGRVDSSQHARAEPLSRARRMRASARRPTKRNTNNSRACRSPRSRRSR